MNIGILRISHAFNMCLLEYSPLPDVHENKIITVANKRQRRAIKNVRNMWDS